ncbi:MAG: DUF1572 domain-containing protein [Planctomycetota bacterium]|nr:MAG: DUF1572 domain-containing protein [Planctomycetota bacterium]
MRCEGDRRLRQGELAVDNPVCQDLLDAARRSLEQNMSQIRRCATLLTDEQAWRRVNSHCNSVANLVLHLTGNIRQWIVAGLGGTAFDRDRPAEFAARDGRPIAALAGSLEHTVREAIEVLRTLTPGDLASARTIQGYEVSATFAVFHAAEHFSFHTGQIIHITKALLDVDLSLYDANGRRLEDHGNKPW